MAAWTPPDSTWDGWLATAGVEADFLQTSEWAEIDEAANGVESLVVRVAGGPAGLVQIVGGDGGQVRCLHGPAFAEPGALDGVAEFVAAAESLARERGARSVELVGRPLRSVVDPETLEARLSPLGYSVHPWSTAGVELQKSEVELFAGVDRAARKAVRRCEREGVSIRLCADAESYERDFLAAFADARPDYDPERGRRAFEIDRGRRYRYYVAVDAADSVLATLGTYRYCGVVTEIMSVRTAAGRASGLPAQDLLHWRVLLDHRGLGDGWYDVAGFAPSPATAAEAGIRRFKKKWGGVEVRTPTFSKGLDSRRRRLTRRLLRRST